MTVFKKSKTIEIEGLGPVLLDRSPRAKRINLSLRPFRGIRVAVPDQVSFRQAEAFARSKRVWLQKHMPQVALWEQAAREFQQAHPINFRQARQTLVERLDQLALQHGFEYNRVFVRRQKTRWGSCSGRKNINLNIHLVHLPAELRDYVILHELVHTRVANHGPRFWETLQTYLPRARRLDRQLNEYRILLF